MAITINTDGISNEQKQSSKFQRAYQEMLAQLMEPGFAHVLCCHEAAHLFYFMMAGTQNYDSFPARIFYDPAVDEYGGTLASVQPLDFQRPTTEAEAQKWLDIAMKAHAVGGVVARKLMPSLPDHGDQDDKERFFNLFKNRIPSIQAEDLWKQAQDAVLRDITEHPEFLAAVEKFAEEELKPKLGLG